MSLVLTAVVVYSAMSLMAGMLTYALCRAAGQAEASVELLS